MSKVRDFAEIISTGVASTDVSGLTTAITNEFTSIEHIASSHIKTTLLYPAISGNITNGTAHSGTYGDTVQTDGHKYYYTDIKGSKPIKDPRIGAHFGSQRHMFKSIQLLEQETATHGDNVYSIDGREWMRGVGSLTFVNGTGGVFVKLADVTTSFFEITGYFNAFNYIGLNSDTNRSFKIEIDGVTATTTFNPNGVVNSPLALRYVSSGSVFNVDLTASSSLSSDTTLGIHTIRISWASGYSNYPTGCELIAQDTTSTTTKSQIQIPSQNVVSYGKKFTVSGTPHYDPFNGFTNSTSLHSAYVDTATSLGLSSAPGSSASWAISGSNNIRPYNGGRVVKWVDSNGVIKTSVNMIPPNAQNISTTASAEITTPSATNTAYLPAMSDDAIDHSLAEVAKTFMAREFGNGAANAGTGGSYKDASMVHDDYLDSAYVMDDGLTSLSAYQTAHNADRFYPHTSSGYYFLTFIGTGISFSELIGSAQTTVAQNLPYGTHTMKVTAGGSSGQYDVWIDGVVVANDSTSFGSQAGAGSEFSFHQPKRPPIPEDACVIADYMLMADFVAIGATGADKISKGVRSLSGTRDVFYDGDAAWAFALSPGNVGGFQLSKGNSSLTNAQKLPFFGSGIINRFSSNSTTLGAATSFTNNGTNFSSPTAIGLFSSDAIDQASAHNAADYGGVSGITLGQYTVESKLTSTSGTTYHRSDGWEVVSPIHTSSHYQTFETPFLHELVGGDRNMEQNNLIVTPDGKSWDEVTRDVSYIGKAVMQTSGEIAASVSDDGIVIFDEWRGMDIASGAVKGLFNKDFAIAYDRLICLVNGQYEIAAHTIAPGEDHAGNLARIFLNGTNIVSGHGSASGYSQAYNTVFLSLKRNDFIQIYGDWNSSEVYSGYKITKL